MAERYVIEQTAQTERVGQERQAMRQAKRQGELPEEMLQVPHKPNPTTVYAGT